MLQCQRVNDKFIMDEMELFYTGATIQKINACRLWLKALTFADIISIQGDRITNRAWKGLHPCQSTLKWPQHLGRVVAIADTIYCCCTHFKSSFSMKFNIKYLGHPFGSVCRVYTFVF